MDKVMQPFKLKVQEAGPTRRRGFPIRLPKDPKFFKELFCCVRCKQIPHPKYYMTCEENNHYLCGSCAWKDTDKKSSDVKGKEAAEALSNSPGEKLVDVGACCAPENLRKGDERFMQKFLDNSLWSCPNEAAGCNAEILGSDWEKHVKECKMK